MLFVLGGPVVCVRLIRNELSYQQYSPIGTDTVKGETTKLIEILHLNKNYRKQKHLPKFI